MGDTISYANGSRLLKKQLKDERVYQAFASTSHSTIEGSQCRNSR